jgi:proteasome regulatory subunit
MGARKAKESRKGDMADHHTDVDADRPVEEPAHLEGSTDGDGDLTHDLDMPEGSTKEWWGGRYRERSWDEEELNRLAWDDEDNPWKRESRRLEEERRYLETKVLRLENKVMALNSELNRVKSPPMIVGTVIETYKDDMVIVSTTGGPTFLVKTSSTIPSGELKVGAKVSMNKDTMTVLSVLPSTKDPLIGATELEVRPETSFKEIGGLEEQISELREVIELPLVDPDAFRVVGIDPPKGVLLIGPPGCGKTLLAKAIANATHATFLRIVGSELVQKYIGEGSRMVRELFQLAREKSPSILFLDEIDREVHRTLIQLLAELDGFDPLGDVRIIAATNRPDILDPAILRPGRIDRIIEIPMPDQTARMDIFRIHTKRMRLDPDLTMEALSMVSDGFNGAQIKAACTESGMFAIREGRRMVGLDDFRKAIRKVRDSASSPENVLRDRTKDTSAMFA